MTVEELERLTDAALAAESLGSGATFHANEVITADPVRTAIMKACARHLPARDYFRLAIYLGSVEAP